MKNIKRKLAIALAGFFMSQQPALADDTEIFNANPTLSATAPLPNVLIILDNTSNWGQSYAGSTKFAVEMQALMNVFSALGGGVNIGIMMQSAGGTDGGYIRFHARSMGDSTYRTALVSIMQEILSRGANSSVEKANNPTYAQTMNEAYQYFRGGTPRAGLGDNKRDCGSGNANNPLASPLTGPHAYASCANSGVSYVSPISTVDPCQKNYIIYVSNGPIANNDNSPGLSLLNTAGGNTATISVTPNGETGSNYSDEWARFLNSQADVSAQAGRQNVVTYTIEVGPATNGQGPSHTAMMRSMATSGGGSYCAATSSLIDIENCVITFLNEIQSVNSVFASVTLPVSVNVRGTNLNQVYIGVFRPDSDAKPRWPGNLKQYQLDVDINKNLFLSDVSHNPAIVASTGVTTDTAVSFWTQASTFWSFNPSGNPASASDSPDGPLVEKGGVAQGLRSVYATSQTGRKLYTCVGCSSTTTNMATAGSTTLFSTGNASITQTMINPAAGATDKNTIIDWIRGADNATDENLNASSTDVRASIHGDILHSRPAVVNFNRYANSNDDVYVFYGANDGLFRAVKGGQLPVAASTAQFDATHAGYEAWAFIPEEFFGRLKRMRDNYPAITSASALTTQTYTGLTTTSGNPNITGLTSAQILTLARGMSVTGTGIPANAAIVGTGTNTATMTATATLTQSGSASITFTPNPKDYFFDGPIGVNASPSTGTPTTVQLFIAMRRGGRLIYALDVSNPDQPKFMWKKGCPNLIDNVGCSAGFTELGQTWSEPKVARINLGGTLTTVLIFGAGYDPAVDDQDPIPAASVNTMGRGIFIVNASDGSIIWQAGPNAASQSASYSAGTPYYRAKTSMTYSIASDITVIDRNRDGKSDRLYVGDTGGNVWRVDIGDQSPANWTVNKLASVGYAQSATNADRRKFLSPPDVVDVGGYDAVLIGSGDREHPFNGYGSASIASGGPDDPAHPATSSVTNRYYMFMDKDNSLNYNNNNSGGVIVDAGAAAAAAAQPDLADNTSANNLTATSRGWFVTFQPGEKVVGSSITLSGSTFFNTNVPTPPSPGVCSTNLGEARQYALSFVTGGSSLDKNSDGTTSFTGDRFTSISSGGFLPSPVGLIVNVDGTPRQAVCSGPNCQNPGGLEIGKRIRTYWRKKLD
jgi:type IV pilus assembly protein PilY1